MRWIETPNVMVSSLRSHQMRQVGSWVSLLIDFTRAWPHGKQGLAEDRGFGFCDNYHENGKKINGQYLKKVHKNKSTQPSKNAKQKGGEPFVPRDFGDHAIAYLQDSFEAPYWCFLAEIFMESCLNATNDENSISFVLRVVNDTQRELRHRVRKIKRDHPDKLPEEIEDGIHRRLSVLDRLLKEITEKFDYDIDQELLLVKQSNVDPSSEPSITTSAHAPEPANNPEPESAIPEADTSGASDLEQVSQSFLFLIFLTIAMVPAFVGFSRYFNDETAVGSFSEADYAWMWSNFLLAVLGNLYAVIPLFKVTRGSWGHRLTWFLICLSTIWGMLSVATYVVLNKAWTSMFGFLNTFFAVASVFASTQQVSLKAMEATEEDGNRKVKKE